MRYLVLLTAAMAGLAGCGGPGSSRSVWNPDSWVYKSSADNPVRLAVAGPVRVDVDSFGGNVTVIADGRRHDHATIRVTREATHGFKRRGDEKASLPNIDYAIDLLAGETGQTLRIRTWSDDPEPWFQRAHLEIELPAVEGLTVRTRHGRVEAVNIEGEVDIESGGGDVRIMTNLPMRRAVTVVNHDGDIDYRVRGESSAAFDCQAQGRVEQRIRFGRLVVHPGTDHDTLLATYNDGRNPVRLHTDHGDIRVAVVAAPTDVGTTIYSP